MPRLPVHTTRHQGFRKWLAGGFMLGVHQILREASVRYYDVEVVIRKPFKTPGPDSEYNKTVIVLADISVADAHANWAIAARNILEQLIALGRDDINVEIVDVESAWEFNNAVVEDDETVQAWHNVHIQMIQELGEMQWNRIGVLRGLWAESSKQLRQLYISQPPTRTTESGGMRYCHAFEIELIQGEPVVDHNTTPFDEDSLGRYTVEDSS